MTKKRIVLLATGGTIASQPDAMGRNRSGAMPGDALLKQVGLPDNIVDRIEVHSVLQKPSNAITFDDLLLLRDHCLVLAESPDIGGIVITHGTDTLEETAYFLDITLPDDLPLVITGSQRALHEPGSDAFRNITDALLVAAEPQASGLGTLVVFNQSIYAASQVRKVSSFQVNGFSAPGSGPLGYIDNGRVRFTMYPSRPSILPLAAKGPLPQISILPAYLGASPGLINAAVQDGAKGLVLDGLGRGHVPPNWLDAISHTTAQGVPVVVVSSCTSGPVHTAYEFIGSLASLEKAGALSVTDLCSRKARLALATLLASPSQLGLKERLKALAT